MKNGEVNWIFRGKPLNCSKKSEFGTRFGGVPASLLSPSVSPYMTRSTVPKRTLALVLLLIFLGGLWLIRDRLYPPQSVSARYGVIESAQADSPNAVNADQDSLSQADIRLLLVGNSHTHSQELPQRIVKLIEFANPGKRVAARTVSVGFLDDALRDPNMAQLLKEHPWNAVVLQAQKISSSGRYTHSTAEGVDLAKQARALGLSVFFYAEWGLKGSVDSTARTDRIYRDMAQASNAILIPVGLVWEEVLRQSPNLELHDFDGNHQSAVGADLTALVIASTITQLPSSTFSAYTPQSASSADWKLFCEHAANPQTPTSEK